MTVKDYDDWLKRAAKAPAIFDQAIVNMREGVKAGIVQPRVLMEKVLPQLEANITDDAEKSIFWGPIKNMPKEFSAADRDRLTAAFRTMITTQLMPAYQRLHAYIADEYLPKTRDTFGMGALPNGAAWYAHKVHDNTTRSMTSGAGAPDRPRRSRANPGRHARGRQRSRLRQADEVACPSSRPSSTG